MFRMILDKFLKQTKNIFIASNTKTKYKFFKINQKKIKKSVFLNKSLTKIKIYSSSFLYILFQMHFNTFICKINFPFQRFRFQFFFLLTKFVCNF